MESLFGTFTSLVLWSTSADLVLVDSENRVHAASAMIRVGISTGDGTWATDERAGDHQIPFGTEIVRNRLSSYAGYYGYAIALSDARGIVVEDNAVRFVSILSPLSLAVQS